MREIKFRGKTKVNGWVYGFLCHDWEIKGPGGGIHIVNKNTVGQYTGLKDRNGKEIFEGDIVLVWENYKYIVKYSQDRGGYYPFATDDGCGCCAEEVASAESSEIIGNIHENPELLEVQP